MTYRNQKLLKAIRELPCQVCGAAAPSQACHSNELRHGKGMGIKASDAAVWAGCPGCHHEIDNGNSLSRSERLELARKAIADTHIALIESGALEVK